MVGEYEWPQKVLGLSFELTDLMAKILEVDPEKRIDCQNIIQHPWIIKYGNNASYYHLS